VTARLVGDRPAPGAPRAYRFPAVVHRRVAGGEVVAADLPGQALGVVRLLLDAGAGREPAGREGLASVVANALEEGTHDRDSAAFAVALERLGGTLTTSVDWDVLQVGTQVPVNRLPAAVALVAEAVRMPRLDAEDVSRVRDDEATARRMRWANPGPRADAALRAEVFPGQRYGRPMGGDPMSIAAVTVDDVVRFHGERLTHAGVLLLAADLSRVDLDVLGAAAFAGVPAEPADGRKPMPVAPAGTRRILLVDRPGSVQSALRLGHAAPHRAHPDYVAMLLAGTVLGGAFTSRLNHLIREVRGYTYGVRAEFAQSRRSGRFGVSCSVHTAATAPALVDTVEEITRMAAGGVTEAELDVARSYRAGSLSVEMQSPSAIARALITIVVHGLPDDHPAVLRRQLLEGSVTDVSAAATAHLKPDGLTLVVEGDAATVREELVATRLGEVVDAVV
jgi:predicted Zn-dependent peptidase